MRRNVFSLVVVILILLFIVTGVTGKGNKDSDPGSSVEERIASLEEEISQLKVILSKNRKNVLITEEGGKKPIKDETNAFSGSRIWTEGTRGWAEDGIYLWTSVNPLPSYNVGIGIANPTYKLQVTGSFRANSINVNGAYTLPQIDGTGGYVLKTNGVGGVSWQQDVGGIGGSGTAGYIPKWTAATTLGNSVIQESNAKIGIGTLPGTKLDVLDNTAWQYATNIYNANSNGYGLWVGVPGNSEAIFAYSPSGKTLIAQVGNTYTQPSGNIAVLGYNSTGSGYGVYYSGGLAGTGTKSCIVRTSKGPTLLYCQESPEVWFEDFGEGRLVNGYSHIELDQLFLETVTINERHPMKVFIQMQDDCKGTYVKTHKTGFDVYEMQGGKSSAHFSYRIVAKRKDFEEKRFGVFEGAYSDHYLYPD